jgi:hypothetical protein
MNIICLRLTAEFSMEEAKVAPSEGDSREFREDLKNFPVERADCSLKSFVGLLEVGALRRVVLRLADQGIIGSVITWQVSYDKPAACPRIKNLIGVRTQDGACHLQ